MTPYKQLLNHAPDKGTWGDCYRTAVGCLLNVLPQEVPHFADDGVTSDECDEKLLEWLSKRGLTRVLVPFDAINYQPILNMMGGFNRSLFYILFGRSTTGCSHAVICYNDAIIHNPSRVDAEIVGPCDDGLYWLFFLAPLDTRVLL